MKLNVKLTANELQDVVNAAMDEAIDRGYDTDNETVNDMLHIVDAALSAIGIEIIPADEDEDEDEDEKDEPEYPDNPVSRCVFIFKGKRVIKESDANEITEAITEIIEDKLGFLPETLKKQIKKDMLTKAFKDNGIEGVVRGG